MRPAQSNGLGTHRSRALPLDKLKRKPTSAFRKAWERIGDGASDRRMWPTETGEASLTRMRARLSGRGIALYSDRVAGSSPRAELNMDSPGIAAKIDPHHRIKARF